MTKQNWILDDVYWRGVVPLVGFAGVVTERPGKPLPWMALTATVVLFDCPLGMQRLSCELRD